MNTRTWESMSDAERSEWTAQRVAQVAAAKPLAIEPSPLPTSPGPYTGPVVVKRPGPVPTRTSDDTIRTTIGARLIATPIGANVRRDVAKHRESVRAVISAALDTPGGFASVTALSPLGTASPRTTRAAFRRSERVLREDRLHFLVNDPRHLWAYRDNQREITALARELRAIGSGDLSTPRTAATRARKAAARASVTDANVAAHAAMIAELREAARRADSRHDDITRERIALRPATRRHRDLMALAV